MERQQGNHDRKKSRWLGDPGNTLIITYILIIVFLLFFCGYEKSLAVEENGMDETTRMGDVRTGELFFQICEGWRFIPPPNLI